MEIITGIYKLNNKVSNNFYIGSSFNIIDRWRGHKCLLRKNKHENQILQNSWNKHGENAFEFIVLETCTKDIILKREQFYIDTLNPKYNICKTAGNCAGRKFSKETLKKMSEIMKKRPFPKKLIEYIDKLRNKYPKDQNNLRFTSCCNLWVEIQNLSHPNTDSRTCKYCFNKKRLTRSIKGAREKYANSMKIPLLATNLKTNEVLEFSGYRDAEKQLKNIFPTFNRVGLRLSIQKNQIYYNFKWKIKCL